MRLTVITPAFNPRADYITRMFESLDAQTLPKTEWEYLLVDSGSEPPLRERLDISWHPNGKMLEAPFKALAKSRFRGLQEARGELVVFVDDDNVLEPAFLEKAIGMMGAYPFIGVLGPYIEGEFEVPPEPWMEEFLIMLSCMQWSPERKKAIQYALSDKCSSVVPPGNGMIVRRIVVDAYIDRVRRDPSWLEIGRVGNSLAGSEDADLALTAIDQGYAMGTTGLITMKHLIPKRRLELDYFLRLLYASNYGTARLQVRRGWMQQAPAPVLSPWERFRSWMQRYRPVDPALACWRSFRKGFEDGIALLPYDEAYR